MGFFSNLFGGSQNNVTGEQAVEMVKDGAQLLDVREKHEWKTGHAAHATHIPLGQVADAGPKRLSKNRPVVVYCKSGMRSKSGAKTLRNLGFDAVSLKGGFSSWVNAGGRSA